MFVVLQYFVSGKKYLADMCLCVCVCVCVIEWVCICANLLQPIAAQTNFSLDFIICVNLNIYKKMFMLVEVAWM